MSYESQEKSYLTDPTDHPEVQLLYERILDRTWDDEELVCDLFLKALASNPNKVSTLISVIDSIKKYGFEHVTREPFIALHNMLINAVKDYAQKELDQK